MTNIKFQLALFFPLVRSNFELTDIHDAPDGVEPRNAAHAHLSEVPVLSRPQVHHPTSEVGLLKHQPVAFHHVTGLAVGHAEAVHHVVTVVHELVHLASEVLPFVDPHSEWPLVLCRYIQGCKSRILNRRSIFSSDCL